MTIPEHDEASKAKADPVSSRPGVMVRNPGKPIILSNVEFNGVSAEAAMRGTSVKVWTRATMCSEQAVFHRVAPNLISVIRHCAQQAGEYPALLHASTILLVIKPDNTAALWIDAAAVMNETRLKRNASSGTVLFESDIADVTGMWFPLVDVATEDRIIVLFREGFRFGLFFDFNPGGHLNIEDAKRDLGTLCRQMRYADLYSVLANEATFKRVVAAGWFPFIEIMTGDFGTLSNACEAGFPLLEAEAELAKKFTCECLDRMFDRWMSRPHFKEKEAILRSGVKAYKEGDWVACLKVVLTEIEGIIAEAYFASTGQHTRRISKLLEFTLDTATKMAGGKDTLFFPVEFAHYLRHYTYADFDVESNQPSVARNAVGHGRAKPEHYTQSRALQALLTLDQFAFYS
ncbi:hypothetical protein [Methylocystis parvus]|uniref:Uncharacterized protein n=1 Tax=Methylocystis parvus TaxID=134 RepID=A0A6B8M5F2_9HYPH|nr:hypothetical protein [Methylocystis parvus]QGM97648.1 hypothetical protein F7D14_09355 [Methylocystis parvus]WBJ98417.1 hypothetical protein MMG94_10235 [Methylocystis parvus OBBP]